MKTARAFFIGIGIFYAVFNFLGTLPFSTAGFLGTMYPGVDLHMGEPIFRLLQDAWMRWSVPIRPMAASATC